MLPFKTHVLLIQDRCHPASIDYYLDDVEDLRCDIEALNVVPKGALH